MSTSSVIDLIGEELDDIVLPNSILELSVTIGYLGVDVCLEEINKLDLLIHDHCVAGLVALERGDVENSLHFQMVVHARTKSARAFSILVRKYMGWFGQRKMNLFGKVTCKVFSNRALHTFKGMVGYYLKDIGKEHFQHAMFNVFDDDIIVGKTLHTIYGKCDLKR